MDEREEELTAIQAIFPELTIDGLSARLDIPVTPATPLLVRFLHSPQDSSSGNVTYANAAASSGSHADRDARLTHLPPLRLSVTLPLGYPEDAPPHANLSTSYDWLPKSRLSDLEAEVAKLWDEYGRCQILFAYIDHLQQAAEQGFGLDQSVEGCLTLRSDGYERELVSFDAQTRKETFESGTYDCGVCLEPKKGRACYQLDRCAHVFCKSCLQDFYQDAITEGNVVAVRCLDPTCGKEQAGNSKKRKRECGRSLHPRELLVIGIEESMVRRYVEMKRKKRLEADRNTIYCPRTWCQGAARSAKYPPIPQDLTEYPLSESSDDSDAEAGLPTPPESPRLQPVQPPKAKAKAKQAPPEVGDKLSVCEKCSLAFCRVCYLGWHGPFARCFPRDPSELSEEEKASYDYIRAHTSPCPTCSSPTQKSMGCNHMKCYQCNTHFCYLCGGWLEDGNPYQHFNKAGTECYQRLWELEEGDNGQNPQDGQGFAGPRRWEQMALDVVREAEREEAEAAAAEEAAAREGHVEMVQDVDRIPAAPDPPNPLANDIPLVVAMAQVQLQDHQQQGRRGRRQRNPFPQARANGVADAVRAHERGGRRRPAGRPAVHGDERQQEELRRFVEMAERDEEDGWDSDELGEDDGFEIR